MMARDMVAKFLDFMCLLSPLHNDPKPSFARENCFADNSRHSRYKIAGLHSIVPREDSFLKIRQETQLKYTYPGLYMDENVIFIFQRNNDKIQKDKLSREIQSL